MLLQPFMAEKRIAHYEVLAEIGKGGMGVVYKAWDTRLERNAAIKALPDQLAEDPERLARFEREAKLLAGLKNRHIATVYGLERVAGRRFLAMELVEGKSLAEKLSTGPIPVPEALRLARQIARALEAAHDAGVIHRDVKPGNIMIGEDGDAKVLDFGLAKALRARAPESELSASPTETQPMTQAGHVLGTPAYMSPEQAKGEEAGKPSDIWAFGCVFYEMLTGKRAFHRRVKGEAEPEPDWRALPPTTPVAVRRLLRRCVAVPRPKRLRDIGDAVLELEDAKHPDEESDVAAGTVSSGSRVGRRSFVWVIAAILLGAGIGWLSYRVGRGAKAPTRTLRANLKLADGQLLRPGWASSVDISPDGSLLVYATDDPQGGRIYLRNLATFEDTPLPGTEGGARPFFSPDGGSVGFFARRQLMRIVLAGGVALPICPANFDFGGAWGPDGTIVFSADRNLYRVNVSSNRPELIAKPDTDAGEAAYLRPVFVPDGTAVVFVVDRGAGTDPDQIAAITVDGTHRVLLAEGAGGQPRYVPGNRLLYGRSTGLLAVGFDPASLRLTTDEVSVLAGVNEYQLAVSSTGTLVYQVASRTTPAYLASVDRSGKSRWLTEVPRAFREPRLSPSGAQVLVVVQEAGETNLWTLDRGRSALTPSTHDGAISGVWLPDGEEIIYSTRDFRLWRGRAAGTGQPEQIENGNGVRSVSSITPDGSAVVVVKTSDETGLDLWLLPLDGSDPTLLVGTDGADGAGMVSPDGEWLAYVSDFSGRSEVHVQRLFGGGDRKQVSIQGGLEPRWSREGTELFYRSGEQLFAVPFDASREPGSPKLLFEGAQTVSRGLTSNYDVGVGASEFLMVEGFSVGTDSLRLVHNWLAELERRLPASE